MGRLADLRERLERQWMIRTFVDGKVKLGDDCDCQ